jgi:hypothetical protein
MAGRQKRKRTKAQARRRHGTASAAHVESNGAGELAPPDAELSADAVEPSARKSKDDLAREKLVPLEEGERPVAVTVAAVIAGLLALSNLIGWIAGIEIGGDKPSVGAVLPPLILMLVMAVGMWYARYWAVLGFQTVLAFLIVFMALLLIRAGNVFAVVATVAIGAGAATLFWFLVKSLARIQMPERRPPS